MNYSNIKYCDISNGPGIRLSLFVSGCNLHCPGCFNTEAWSFTSGKEYTTETENEILMTLEDENYQGLSILGGEPLDPDNVYVVRDLIQSVRETLKKEISIWVFTGYDYEILSKRRENDPDLDYIFKNIEVLVDGPFIAESKNIQLRFKGSENQRTIDMRETEKFNQLTLWDLEDWKRVY